MARPDALASGVRRVEALRLLALRHLQGSRLRRQLPSPPPGYFVGAGPRCLWRSPTEWLWIGDDDAAADALLARFAPGLDPLSCAVDLSDAMLVLVFDAAAIERLLPQGLDATHIPAVAGTGTRLRLAEVAVTLLRVGPGTLWLLADRAHGAYLAAWLEHADGRSESLDIERSATNPARLRGK